MQEHHLPVTRTARYHTLGDPATAHEVWIVLHGYGQLARFFLRAFQDLEEGRYIVAPEALSRFYLDEAHSRVGATWMTREDRDTEIADQITHLDALKALVLRRCPNATTVSALGFSQGVATLCRWAASGATRLNRLVLWGGSMPPELTAAQLKERWASTQVDLVHGEQDAVVTELSLAKNEALLHEARIPHAVHAFAGGHALDRLTLHRLFDGTL